MEKTLIVGDVHDKWSSILPEIDTVVSIHRIQRIVFLGDLTNEWNISAIDEFHEIKALHDWVKQQSVKIDILIGNHDVYYLLDARDNSDGAEHVRQWSPGHHYELKGEIKSLLMNMGVRLKAALTLTVHDEDVLLSHAGFMSRWLYAHMPNAFTAKDIARETNSMLAQEDWQELYTGFGDTRMVCPGPLWARIKELRSDAVTGIPQIVGHTPVDTISYFEPLNADQRGHWPLIFCDTLSLYGDGVTPIGDKTVLLISDDQYYTIPLGQPDQVQMLERKSDYRYDDRGKKHHAQ